MPITRSQQREIDRKEREAKQETVSLRTAVEASLTKWPAGLDRLEKKMNDLNTSDDLLLHNAHQNKKYHQGRPLGREHTDPMNQPQNMDPPSISDTSKVPKFTAAAIKKYQAHRLESMFYTQSSDTEASTNSTTFISHSSGDSTTVLSFPRDPLSSLTVNSELDELRLRHNSDDLIQVVERRLSASSTTYQTDSSTTENFSISDRHSPVP
ncbi:hypothetical protein [Parasitella parasitica]|uniref:Uncharacterized protein n=1 Tax=Parasitella parasitica TaxID=35722 RepID=A0A0B7N632_9FUNG|nr:hypothetical protein [Parasitella parasitica]